MRMRTHNEHRIMDRASGQVLGVVLVLLAWHASRAGTVAAATAEDRGAGPAGSGRCTCPLGDEELTAWLACIGLEEEERARILDQEWTARDLRLMSLDEAEAALGIRRALAWRITR
jgi:hypothetical protein